MAHNARRHCGATQAAARKVKNLRQFSRTAKNLARKGKTNKKSRG